MNSLYPNILKHKEKLTRVRSFIPVVLIGGIIFVLGLSFTTGYLSFLILWLLCFGGALLYFSRFSEHSRYLFELFSFAFIFYTLYMGITTYLLVDDPTTDFFYAHDSTKFWIRSEGIASLSELWATFNQNAVGLESVGGFRVFYFMTLVVSYLSSLIDENNIYVQKLAVVFIGALASPYIFMILKKYTDPYYAYLTTLVFIVFSHASTFSVEFLRDSYTYFFYVLGFYLVTVERQSNGILFKLLLISLLVFFIRPEHGVFFLFFVAAFVYLNKRTNKLAFAFAILMMPALLYLSSYLVSMSLETYSTYDDVRQRVGESTDSLAARFANYPFGVKHLILAFLSQTTGVPFWRYLFYDGSDIASVAYKSHNGWRFMEAISGTLWIFVWGYIIYAVRRYRVYLKQLPREITVLCLVAFLLLLAGTADINVRRIFCVYPILYTVAVLIRYRLPKNARRLVIQNSFLVIVGLYVIYFMLKG